MDKKGDDRDALQHGWKLRGIRSSYLGKLCNSAGSLEALDRHVLGLTNGHGGGGGGGGYIG